jgi:hypothetical protein
MTLALGLFALAVVTCVVILASRIYRWWRWARVRRYLRQVERDGYRSHRRRDVA